MDTKEKIKKRYAWERQRMQSQASNLQTLAAKFAALNSYCSRKMTDGEMKYIKNWIYDIMDIIDYKYNNDYEACLLFEKIYQCGYQDEVILENLTDIQNEYWRAVSTFGEVKLSILPGARRCPETREEDEIENNLSQLQNEDLL